MQDEEEQRREEQREHGGQRRRRVGDEVRDPDARARAPSGPWAVSAGGADGRGGYRRRRDRRIGDPRAGRDLVCDTRSGLSGRRRSRGGGHGRPEIGAARAGGGGADRTGGAGAGRRPTGAPTGGRPAPSAPTAADRRVVHRARARTTGRAPRTVRRSRVPARWRRPCPRPAAGLHVGRRRGRAPVPGRGRAAATPTVPPSTRSTAARAARGPWRSCAVAPCSSGGGRGTRRARSASLTESECTTTYRETCHTTEDHARKGLTKGWPRNCPSSKPTTPTTPWRPAPSCSTCASRTNGPRATRPDPCTSRWASWAAGSTSCHATGASSPSAAPGARSRAVGEALAGEGFDVVNAFGGLKAWEAFGYDVVDDTGRAGVVI